jgi:hypothetical protein
MNGMKGKAIHKTHDLVGHRWVVSIAPENSDAINHQQH